MDGLGSSAGPDLKGQKLPRVPDGVVRPRGRGAAARARKVRSERRRERPDPTEGRRGPDPNGRRSTSSTP